VLSSTKILALDIGAGKATLAEFTVRGATAPMLTKYALETVPADSDAALYLGPLLKRMMKAGGFSSAPLLMTLPGQSVFPRFVKLPMVERNKVASMVQYEAEQNIPFPLSEVVWDYQIVGDANDVEINALLVAVKKGDVQVLADAVASAGLSPDVVEAAPLAIYNAVRYNYPHVRDCLMVLDIGAKATNLVFVEGNRLFTRSIPVAGNSITQEIAKGLNIEFAEAEAYKRAAGFVALGGVYAVADDEKADRVSKMIRNVATRLHAEVNRSINFYRSQQGGGIPSRVLLTGGASMLPHLDTFFREKMQVDVELLNPFINVAVADNIARAPEEEKRLLLQLGGVVGLALRRTMRCPVEINLLPEELQARKTLLRRLPYFGIAALGVLLTMGCWWLYAKQMEEENTKQKEHVESLLAPLDKNKGDIDKIVSDQKGYENRIHAIRVMAQNRHRYAKVLDSIRDEMRPGMWLTQITPGKSAPDMDGYDVLRLEGLAYEDSWRANYKVGDGTIGLDMFYSNLSTKANGPFVRTERETPGAEKGAGVVKSSLQPNNVFRDFIIALRLKTPLGGSAMADDEEETSEEGEKQ